MNSYKEYGNIISTHLPKIHLMESDGNGEYPGRAHVNLARDPSSTDSSLVMPPGGKPGSVHTGPENACGNVVDVISITLQFSPILVQKAGH